MRLLFAAICTAVLLSLAGPSEAGGKKDESKTEAKGSLTLNGTTYKLASALAYEQTVFRKKETVVILSEKRLDTAKLKQSLQKNGNDDDFFPTAPHVKLAFDQAGELLQLSIHGGGANIIRSGDPNVKTTVTLKDGAAKGTAGTQKPDTFRNQPLQFDVTFEVDVIPLTRSGTEPKPAVDPKPKVTTKTTPAKPRPQPATPLSADKDLRFEGELADDSPRVLGKPAKIHQVRMSPGKTYVLDLESSEFDAYLRILDSTGKQVASDDDGGEGLNSRIRFRPAKEGTYQLVATRFNSDQGNYVLKVRAIQEQQPAAEKELRFDGKLDADSRKLQGKPVQVHEVRMSADRTYVIDMESSDFDAYLRILDSTGKQLASNDDGGEGRNARLRFTPPRDGNYQVVATRFGNREGNYLLKIRVLLPDDDR